MDEIGAQSELTFNGPLEAGVRAVAILGAAFPRSFDLQRMTILDYLIVRTGVLGGPRNLHPDTPIKTPATEVRRRTVQDALNLMMTRNLVDQLSTDRGIEYRAGDNAAMFLDALSTPYFESMKDRVGWLIEFFADYDGQQIDELMNSLFDRWVAEFQEIELSLGVAS